MVSKKASSPRARNEVPLPVLGLIFLPLAESKLGTPAWRMASVPPSRFALPSSLRLDAPSEDWRRRELNPRP